MRTRSLAASLLLLAAAVPAQAGWKAPEPVHLLRGGFHKSDSAGKRVVRSPKEFKDPEWGRISNQIFKHPVRPTAGHLKN